MDRRASLPRGLSGFVLGSGAESDHLGQDLGTPITAPAMLFLPGSAMERAKARLLGRRASIVHRAQTPGTDHGPQQNNKKESLKQIREQIHDITKLTLSKLSSVQINDQEIKESVANVQSRVKL